MAARPGAATTELVPIADRLRYMEAFRLAVGAIVGAAVAVRGDALAVPPRSLLAATAAYGVLALAAHFGWRLSRRGGLAAFGTMLMVDGAYLAWASYATGGAASPLRYVVVVHLVAVCLLASYRTGLKVALWDTLLLLVVFYAQRGHVLHPLTTQGPGIGLGGPLARLVEFSAALWVVALSTSTLSAINERELRRRRYDLESLATMATRLEHVTEPADVAAELVERVADTFDFRRVLLLAAGDDRLPTLLAATNGVRRDAPFLPAQDGSVYRQACAERRTLLVTRVDARADPWLAELLPEGRNLVVVPLTAGDQTVGALVAERAGRASARIERRIVGTLERFVSHGTLALRNAWLLEHVREAAVTDWLTGLTNRAVFDEALERELARAARHGEPVSLVMADIDHFKHVNDLHGHQVGDDVLRRVAATLRTGCRDFDTAARYGGEEFALVLPGTDADEATRIADRLRAAIAADPEEPRVTASAGVATFPLDAGTPAELVAAADAALYAAKLAGRNRVVAKRLAPAPTDAA